MATTLRPEPSVVPFAAVEPELPAARADVTEIADLVTREEAERARRLREEAARRAERVLFQLD